MAYRNKTYVAFDGDNDIIYYYLMRAWKQNDNIPFDFFDAHDLNTARDSSQEDSIKKQLAQRMCNSKVFVLLLGEHTKYLRKFVLWEIEQAISKKMPIIVVNLNKYMGIDSERCPFILEHTLAIHISYSPKILQYALEHWPQRHQELLEANDTEPRYYKESVYKELGLL